HQLRGRVGRGKHKSYCILVSESKNAVSLERLNVMKATSNGYKIAEKDLELRGPGDFFPSQSGEARQHGGYKFKVASMIDDMTIMTNAVEAAHGVIANDPALELPEHQPMLDAVMHVFEVNERTFN
ncbi:MAG: ATP-dependent DNA helicase RecG, partial [Oscillospiraceae bacterium]|nr:ATP-dependent DNA helicase RecG [Oscillospiraceae bacterium]